MLLVLLSARCGHWGCSCKGWFCLLLLLLSFVTAALAAIAAPSACPLHSLEFLIYRTGSVCCGRSCCVHYCSCCCWCLCCPARCTNWNSFHIVLVLSVAAAPAVHYCSCCCSLLWCAPAALTGVAFVLRLCQAIRRQAVHTVLWGERVRHKQLVLQWQQQQQQAERLQQQVDEYEVTRRIGGGVTAAHAEWQVSCQ